MGAALLSKPEIAADILGTLRRNINTPITCKVRLLHSDADTVEMVRRLERMGVSAIAMHARHIEDRPRHRALPDRVRIVADALNVPLLYNGDVFYSSDIAPILAETGAAGVMVARGAMWNASIFRPHSVSAGAMLPLAEVVRSYVGLARQCESVFANTKYCVLEMLKTQVGSSALFRGATRAKDLQALEAVLEGMHAEPALTGPYRVAVQLEERPAAHACASFSSGALAQSGSSDAAPMPGEECKESATTAAAKKLSSKERKYQAKQNRKNRAGRALEAEAGAAAAQTAASSPSPDSQAAPAVSSDTPAAAAAAEPEPASATAAATAAAASVHSDASSSSTAAAPTDSTAATAAAASPATPPGAAPLSA
jgi:hypothetical protein